MERYCHEAFTAELGGGTFPLATATTACCCVPLSGVTRPRSCARPPRRFATHSPISRSSISGESAL
jgi:hypothetical protein